MEKCENFIKTALWGKEEKKVKNKIFASKNTIFLLKKVLQYPI